jgi:cytochrome c oxidase subunit 2
MKTHNGRSKKMKAKTSLFVLLVALAAILTLTACGKSTNSNGSVSSPASASASASSPTTAGGETKKITITASNWKFDKTEIKAHIGDTIKLSLVNESGIHSVFIEDLGVEVKAGETKEFKVTKAGTFEYHCNITCGQGHDNMSGNLIVE